MPIQPFVYPADLFLPDEPGEPQPWVCIRTKSRAEKKMADWLAARDIRHFLPVIERKQTSYRKTRISYLPLFTSYVFVQGRLEKADFIGSSAVVQIIKPHAEQIPQLAKDIWNVWKGLAGSSHLELTQQLTKGQIVEVVSGPLKGLQGRFEKWKSGRRLVLWVDMLGVGVWVDIPDGCVVKPI